MVSRKLVAKWFISILSPRHHIPRNSNALDEEIAINHISLDELLGRQDPGRTRKWVTYHIKIDFPETVGLGKNNQEKKPLFKERKLKS